MSEFGKQWLMKFIPAALVAITGISGIGAIADDALSVASGSPVKSVIKDIAKDEIKEQALNTLYGTDEEDGNNASIFDLFKENKYKYVSDKKSGPWGYIAPGWYVECYRIDTDAYIGNRKYNKANGVNMKWNMLNASDFEIGDFKKNEAKSKSYIAYDSSTFSLVLGEVKKYNLNGYCMIYDEYYNTFKITLYKKGEDTGKAIIEDEGNIKYVEYDEDLTNYTVLSTYNFESNEFEKEKGSSFFSSNKPKGDIKITKEDSTYTIDFDDSERVYKVDASNDYVEYKTEYCDFKGNAFQFDCKYNYNKKGDWVDYKYTTMQKTEVECSDGTVGEVKVLEDEDITDKAQIIRAISTNLIKAGAHATVDVILSGELEIADSVLEMTTGESIKDNIKDTIDDAIDDALGNDEDNSNTDTDESNNTDDSNDSTDDSDDESIFDKVNNFVDDVTGKDKNEEPKLPDNINMGDDDTDDDFEPNYNEDLDGWDEEDYEP